MIKEIMAAYAKSLEKVWKHDRTKSVGASEIGQCARKINWLKNEVIADEDNSDQYGGMLRGTMMETYFWVPAMQKRFGKNLLFAGSKQKTLFNKELSATPDGLVINQSLDALKDLGVKDLMGDCFAVECKTIDPRVNITEEKSEHFHQVQVQLGLIREKTKYKPMYGVISYIDASFWHEVAEYPVKFEPEIYEQAKKRAAHVLSNVKHPAEGWIGGGKECEYCAFTKKCGIVRKSVPESEAAADPQFVAEITDLCTEYRAAKDTVDAAESMVRATAEKIKERLRDKGVRKIKGIVSWSPQKGRTSYDMVALREAATKKGIDVEEFSTVGEATDRLTVSI